MRKKNSLAADIYYTSFRYKPVPKDFLARLRVPRTINKKKQRKQIVNKLLKKGYNPIDNEHMSISYIKQFSGVIYQELQESTNGWIYGWGINRQAFDEMATDTGALSLKINCLVSKARKEYASTNQTLASPSKGWPEYYENIKKARAESLNLINDWLSKYGEFRNEIWGESTNVCGRVFAYEYCRYEKDLDIVNRFAKNYLKVFGFLEAILPPKYRKIQPDELKVAIFVFALYCHILEKLWESSKMEEDEKKKQGLIKYIEFVNSDQSLIELVNKKEGTSKGIRETAATKTMSMIKITTEKHFLDLLKKERKTLAIMKTQVANLRDPISLAKAGIDACSRILQLPVILQKEKASSKENEERRKWLFVRSLYKNPLQ